MTGGLDKTKAPCRSDNATFYTMANMRQSNSTRGIIEQTPRFWQVRQFTQGTIYNGATSITEPTSSAVVWSGTVAGVSGTLTLTQYCAFDDTTQLKGLMQTTVPAGTGVTKGCLLKVINPTTMTVTLGSTYDVVIDGTNTFKWRVNGGAYTTGVVIDLANGNLIDSSRIQLYWLASTGFTVTDTWSWTRTDSSASVGNAVGSYLTPVIINGVFYYIDSTGQLNAIEKSSSGTTYIRSAGYRPVFGYNVGYFEGHLFVFGSNSTGTAGGGSYVLTSDNTTFENFIATDVNEADATLLPVVTNAPVNAFYVINGFVLQSRLYVITTNGIYYTDYLGLPTVFSFKQLLPFTLTIGNGNTCILTTKRAYILRNDALFSFDGMSIKQIFRFDDVITVSPVSVVYNSYVNEVVIDFKTILLVYQEEYNTFYTRAVDIAGVGHTGITFNTTNSLYIGTINRKLYTEDTDWALTPVFDSATGSAFAVPTLTTQLLGGGCSNTKELNPVYLGATPSVSASAGYSVGSAVKIILSWYLSTDGLISGSPLTDANAYWISTKIDGLISFPRTSYRYIAFELTITGTDGAKPPTSTTIQALETMVYAPKEVKR
jgi:hypothetical protein